MNKTLIISNGDFDERSIRNVNLEEYEKISVDGGIRHFKRMGISPDLLIGDFDSADPSIRNSYKDIRLIGFDSDKDKTDTELAVEYSISKGTEEIILIGATGTRIDHTLGNINILHRLDKLGIRSRIVDANNEVMVVSKGIELAKDDFYKYISIMPFGGRVRGLNLSGFKYDLYKRDFEISENTGISNEFMDTSAYISMESGSVLIIRSRDT